MSGHEHEFPLPDSHQEPTGADIRLLASVIGAAFDGCTSCQDAELTRLVLDPVTTARLVELACLAVQSALGGLPAILTAAGGQDPFARLAAAGLDGRNAEMFALCDAMAEAERRAAANRGLDLIIGLMPA